MSNARLIAYYLPQYHPTKENNEWHGEGFTEWTNVGKAKPLFRGHEQPKVPADLGYYDLRLEDVRIKQARMAAEYGIEGFCYWHYWFGNGKRLLDEPFTAVLNSGKPDYPFCLAWANETWKGVWHGVSEGKILIKQEYLGVDDYTQHFNSVLSAFKDARYIKIDGKPVFGIYKPLNMPDISAFIELWRELAVKNNLKGIHFIGHTTDLEDIRILNEKGFDGINLVRLYEVMKHNVPSIPYRILHRLKLRYSNVFSYKKAIKYYSGPEDKTENIYPTLIPNWDHSPRSQTKGLILKKSTPELFRMHVRRVLQNVSHKNSDHKVVFIKSWNEWGEGNYLEPDIKFGKQYLEVLKEELTNK